MAADKKVAILTAESLRASDPALKDLPVDKYSKPVSDEMLAKTKEKLESVGHKVTICNTAADATKLLASLIPDGASLGCGASITLEEIGFIEYLKTRSNIKNYRSMGAELMAKGDGFGAAEVRRQSMTADYYFSSVSAVAQSGEIVGADLTGSRVGPWANSAKNLVLVCGTNKIVSTKDDALKRLQDYQFHLESARCRIAYKTPGSSMNNVVIISKGSPFSPGRIHVVFVKGSFGY